MKMVCDALLGLSVVGPVARIPRGEEDRVCLGARVGFLWCIVCPIGLAVAGPIPCNFPICTGRVLPNKPNNKRSL
jgi:hypothetical protein